MSSMVGNILSIRVRIKASLTRIKSFFFLGKINQIIQVSTSKSILIFDSLKLAVSNTQSYILDTVH